MNGVRLPLSPYCHVDIERGELVIAERYKLDDGLEVPAEFRDEIEYQYRRYGLTPPNLRYA